jgi:hypothetical protein
MAQETEDPQDYYEPIEQDVDMAQCLKEGLILIPPPHLVFPLEFPFLPLVLNFGTRFSNFFCLEHKLRKVFPQNF